MYEYNPGNLPGLPAGWEIGVDGDTLSLWRVQAYLQPFKEDRYENALIFACGREADAYLPPNYRYFHVEEALQELVEKAQRLDAAEEDPRVRFDSSYTQANRPSRRAHFRKYL